MFTGLVRTVGEVVSTGASGAGLRLGIRPQTWPWRREPGDSICVSGCCLTLVEAGHDGVLRFDAIPETLSKTTLGSWAAGRNVNLEPSMAMGDPVGGHTVQGHVDGVGTVLGVDKNDGWRVRIETPAAVGPYLVDKGSVAVDGVSLTIARTGQGERGAWWFEVALIPETLDRTTLRGLEAGDAVNLEADIFAKTVGRMVEQYLQRAGGGS